MNSSAPSIAKSRPHWPIVHAAGALLAMLAGVRHAALITRATNDNFLHLALAQQWLAGDWPVRDFYEGGWVLQYSLSAVAHLAMGNRLLGETVVVALSWAFTTYLVFAVVLKITGSGIAAMSSALVPLLAVARGYSYPKGIVYAVAAALWWSYVSRPTIARAAVFGAWGAAAFYWRPDHGVYVAAGIVLAMWAVHGFGRTWLTRCAAAGGTMLVLVAPFLLYVQLTVGLPEYVETGVVQGRVEHTTQGPHAWPILRLAGNLFTVEPAEEYAPVIRIRWSATSTPESRHQLLVRYELAELESEADSLARVRLSKASIRRLRELVNEPIVEDTAGIDRSTGLLSEPWPTWQQWKFAQPLLRVRALPDLDGRERINEIVVALFYLLPLVVAIVAPFMARRLPAAHGARTLVAFAVFGFLVDLAMLRMPFTVRAFDAVVLPAILFGCCVTWMWRAAASRVPRALSRVSAVAVAVVVLMTVARAGEFTAAVSQVVADVRASLAGGNQATSFGEIVASPPLSHYLDRSARFTLRLAAYVRECVPATDRLLVLWFEPEVYYYSERLMAQRHLVFAPAWAALEHEQRRTLDKIERYAPPLALASASALEEYARITYPGVVDYVEREYRLANTVENGGEQYLIFARRDRPPVRGFGTENWPCFTSGSSQWARVGIAAK